MQNGIVIAVFGQLAYLAQAVLALDVDARIRHPELNRLFDIGKKTDIAIAPCLLDTSRERAMVDKPIWNWRGGNPTGFVQKILSSIITRVSATIPSISLPIVRLRNWVLAMWQRLRCTIMLRLLRSISW